MQGFDDKTTVTAAVAGGIVEHLSADTVQRLQVAVFRALASPQFDLD